MLTQMNHETPDIDLIKFGIRSAKYGKFNTLSNFLNFALKCAILGFLITSLMYVLAFIPASVTESLRHLWNYESFDIGFDQFRRYMYVTIAWAAAYYLILDFYVNEGMITFLMKRNIIWRLLLGLLPFLVMFRLLWRLYA